MENTHNFDDKREDNLIKNRDQLRALLSALPDLIFILVRSKIPLQLKIGVEGILFLSLSKD